MVDFVFQAFAVAVLGFGYLVALVKFFGGVVGHYAFVAVDKD